MAASSQQMPLATVPVAGTVVLRVVIGPDGVPSDPEVIKSSTPSADKSAVESVQRWRFRPATRKGKPIPMAAIIEINSASGTGGTASKGPVVTQNVTGSGGTVDPNGRAVLRWYLKAAAAGDADAQLETARRLSSKKDGNYDLVHASAWATIAERRGSKQAGALRARLAKRMTSEELQAADKIAADWQPGKALGDNPASGRSR